MKALLILVGVLVVSNVLTGRAYLAERDAAVSARNATTTATGERDGARAAASACSDAVEDLRTLGDRRAAAAAPAREAAASRAAGYDRKADAILTTPAPVPGDACASAQARVNAWLTERARP